MLWFDLDMVNCSGKERSSWALLFEIAHNVFLKLWGFIWLKNGLHTCAMKWLFFPVFSSLTTWGLWSPGKSICKTSQKQHWRKTLRMAIQRDCLFSVSCMYLDFFQFDLRFPMFTHRAMVYVYRIYTAESSSEAL